MAQYREIQPKDEKSSGLVTNRNVKSCRRGCILFLFQNAVVIRMVFCIIERIVINSFKYVLKKLIL